MKAHCFFEQSGTFKNEFKKLGIDAEDYDIRNDFGETDHVIDLFMEIGGGYEGKPSVFDDIASDDLIMAFFPCTRFEDQVQLCFRGVNFGLKNWTEVQKLEYSRKLHHELSEYYDLITKLALVCLRRKIPLIIENPYSTQHHLVKYWPIQAAWIDKDRTLRGDSFVKPTQYWFFNCEPKHNIIFEAMEMPENVKTIEHTRNQVERSAITPTYARRFIREFIL